MINNYNIIVSEEDRALITRLHKAYQSSKFASRDDITREYKYFKGWSLKGGLDIMDWEIQTGILDRKCDII